MTDSSAAPHTSRPVSGDTHGELLHDRPWLAHYTPGTQAQLDYGQETLASIFRDAVENFGQRPALWFLGSTWTYAQYGEEVARAADVLHRAGVRPGDRVAIVLPNCPQNLIAFFAVISLGATAINHNPLYTARELEGPFKDHRAKVAIVWDNAMPVAEHLLAHTPLTTVFSVNLTAALPRMKRWALRIPLPALRAARAKLTGGPNRHQDFNKALASATPSAGRELIQRYAPAITPESSALILYTSGTTGEPKGAELIHRNLVANLRMGQTWVRGLGEGEEGERMLAALPMFHAYGLTMNGTLAPVIGGELLLVPAPDPKLLVDVVKRRSPTWIPGVPALYLAILDAADATGVSLNGVRNSFSGASTLPEETVERWEKATGGLLVEGYGLTETSPIVLGNPMSTDRRPGYVGIPFPDTEARIVDPENPERTLPPGEAGELLVRGPQVFKGYLNKPEATRASFVGDWFRTGDMAIMEEDGFVRIVSRIKEMIITGGFNVYPAEVEGVLSEHEVVERVAVVGLPKEDGSERVVAAIVTKGGAVLDAGVLESLRTHCRSALTPYKVPREFYRLEDLASDLMGKVRRGEVRQQVLDLVQRQR